MPQFAHLIFDLDGTLVDTKADLAAATNHVLASFGLPQLLSAQVADYVGHGVRVLVERALGPAHADLVARGFALFMDYYGVHLLDHTRPYAGIEQLLAAVQAQGLTLSVLTNKPEAASRAIVTGLGLAAYFREIVGGDTLPAKKPDPQGVTYLQRLTGVDLHQTLLIGDSRVDCETGRAAGIVTCGVTWGFGVKDFAALPPQFVVNTPEQLGELVLR
ncbi:MAG TPA: HAD-IA family hydrolase [Candidatus Binatia bacterium]|jgi:phosphoglycolate phosphatase|nr:HAD-IA family hydrolase [Candidatus Binatia bacterium]